SFNGPVPCEGKHLAVAYDFRCGLLRRQKSINVSRGSRQATEPGMSLRGQPEHLCDLGHGSRGLENLRRALRRRPVFCCGANGRSSGVTLVTLDRTVLEEVRRGYPGYLPVRADLYAHGWKSVVGSHILKKRSIVVNPELM